MKGRVLYRAVSSITTLITNVRLISLKSVFHGEHNAFNEYSALAGLPELRVQRFLGCLDCILRALNVVSGEWYGGELLKSNDRLRKTYLNFLGLPKSGVKSVKITFFQQ